MIRQLTGRIRARNSRWTGKVILQVEESWRDDCPYSGPRTSGTTWRDAELEDLSVICLDKNLEKHNA